MYRIRIKGGIIMAKDGSHYNYKDEDTVRDAIRHILREHDFTMDDIDVEPFNEVESVECKVIHMTLALKNCAIQDAFRNVN